jgi:uncharacterized RDD family membrane protein YckC
LGRHDLRFGRVGRVGAISVFAVQLFEPRIKTQPPPHRTGCFCPGKNIRYGAAALCTILPRGVSKPMQRAIDIRTAQNVTIEYELAPLRERMLALLLDYAIISVAYLVLLQLLLLVLPNFTDNGWIKAFVVFPYLLFFLYNILFEIWNNGQTPGKRAMNIKVVRLDGKDPEWSDVVLRALLHLVDTIFSLGIIGALLIKTTNKHQRLGDIAANTTVIRLFSARFQFQLQDILNISSLGNYVPQFPQVRDLNERDMIFVKNVLERHQDHPNAAHEVVVEDLVTRLTGLLEVRERPVNDVEFLKTLLRDYIVLTR